MLCHSLCNDEVAEVIIPLHVLSECDSNSGFYGHGKKQVYDGIVSNEEARHLLQKCGESIPATDAVLRDMIKFVIKYIYSDRKSSTLAEARAVKWKKLKE